MRAHDPTFVTLVAVGAGWALAAGVLEYMAGAESRSLVWLPLGMLFFLLSCAALCLALARGVWRMRHRLLRSRPLLALACVATLVPMISMSLGLLVPSWILGASGLTAMVVFRRSLLDSAA